jgi:hypothetical protein
LRFYLIFMREFRLAKSWRITTYFLCVVFTIVAGYLLYMLFSTPFINKHIFYPAGSLALLFLVYYMYKDTRSGKFIITDEDLTLISPFGRRTLRFENIRGYRKIENYLVIIPESKAHKQIKVSTYLGDSNAIEEWLAFHFPNVDDLETEQEEMEIAQNEEFGITEESRHQRLEEARKVAKYANRGAWVLMLWIVFYPHPHTLAVALGIAYPLVAIGICYFYRGMMKGGDREKSAYPSVIESFVLPGVAIALRALMDYNILFYDNAWIMLAVLVPGLFLLFQIPTGGFRPRKAADYVFLAIFPLFTFGYSFGTVININCLTDRSTPADYNTVIEGKRISKGKTTTYYLDLRPWGDLKEKHEVKVSRKEYEKAKVNDPVTVVQRKGYFNIPWVTVHL